MVGTTGKATEQIILAENALAAGRFKEAADALRKVLPLVQESPRPQLMLGYALWRAGQRAEAIQTLQRLTEILPGNADAWFNLGNFYRAERRLDDAVAAFRRAAPLRSDNAESWINLGYVLAQQGDFAQAERELREAITRFPGEPELLVNLAQVQRATHRSSEALALLERSVQLAPRHTGYRVTRALARLELGKVQAAHAELDQLIREHPELPDAHMARAQLLLAQRQYAAGWRDYLWRRERASWLAAEGRPFTTVAATLEQLAGRPVVLCGEQGLGDVLFFLRFAALVARAASSVHLEVEPRLHAILPPELLSPARKETVRILVGDLPVTTGGDPAAAPTFPLFPDAGRVAEARARLLQSGPPPYLGITWQAGVRWQDMTAPGAGLFKRVPPNALGKVLARTRATLISLQRGSLPQDLADLATAVGRPVHDFSNVNEDLPAAVALLSLLDDYVAVSNTNVHLNDALGRRTRVLVTSPAEWRWCLEGARSPWFAHATLYRQTVDGAWDSALERLERDLAEAD